jgi:hypothetical protein
MLAKAAAKGPLNFALFASLHANIATGNKA